MSTAPTPTPTYNDPDERIYAPLERYQQIDPNNVKPARIYNGPKLNAAVFTMLPGQVHEPHKHPDQTQMWIIVSGRGEVLLDGRKEIVGPGAIVVHHPEQFHGIKTVGDENLVYLTIGHRGPH